MADVAELLNNRSRAASQPALSLSRRCAPPASAATWTARCPPKRTDAKDDLPSSVGRGSAARSVRRGAAGYGGASYPTPLSLDAVVAPKGSRSPLSPYPSHLIPPARKRPVAPSEPR